MRKDRVLTDDEIVAKYKRDAMNGQPERLSIQIMAELCGGSAKEIIEILRNRGIEVGNVGHRGRPAKYSELTKTRAHQLYDRGYNAHEIETEMNLSRGVVRQWVKRGHWHATRPPKKKQ